MTQYYIIDKTSKGTPRTTLPVLLNKELLEHTLIKISSPEDLDWIRNMAQDRTTWKNFTEVIITGAKEKYDEVRKRKRTDLTPTSTAITPNRPRTSARDPFNFLDHHIPNGIQALYDDDILITLL
jgi:hypothetical protein